MRFGVGPAGTRIEATRDTSASCGICKTSLVAKLGDVYAHHWAHKSTKDCDPWADGESAWHSGWKNAFPAEWQEAVIGPHRADVLTPGGFVVEVQYSALAPDRIAEREEFYGDMCWVLASATWAKDADWPADETGIFYFRRPKRVWLYFSRPLFIDFGMWGDLRRLFRISAADEYYGRGEWTDEADFVKWVEQQKKESAA